MAKTRKERLIDELEHLRDIGRLTESQLYGNMVKIENGDLDFADNFIKRIKGEEHEETEGDIKPLKEKKEKKEKKNKSLVKTQIPKEEPKEKPIKKIKPSLDIVEDDNVDFIAPKGSEKQDFEKNHVLLWGIHEADKNLLKQYAVGNKNPHSKAKVKTKGQVEAPVEEIKEEKPKQKRKQYDAKAKYTYEDIPFLESVVEKLNDDMDNGNYKSMSEEDMIDLEESITNQISELKYSKGEGLKSFAGAGKARAVKGSEEAKAIGRRLAEARAKKKAEKQEVEPVKEVKPKRKPRKLNPWYYIGDMPSGYREATEDEAIRNKKVSQYGKYQVDHIKYKYFTDYNILLSNEIDEESLRWGMKNLLRQIKRAHQDLEIFDNKLDNPKYESRYKEFESKLESTKVHLSDLSKAYNFYNKLKSKREGTEYVKKSFKVKKEEYIAPKEEKEEEEIKPVYYEEDKIIKKEPYPFHFKRGNDEVIDIKQKYFDSNGHISSKNAKMLFDNGVVLEQKHYSDNDIPKYFYHKEGSYGTGFVKFKPDETQSSEVQTILFNKRMWTEDKAKEWLIKNHFHSLHADETKDKYRYRQLNPEDLKDGKYITKPIKNKGIDIVIYMRKKPIELDSDSDEELSHDEARKQIKQHRKDFEGGKINIGGFFKNVGRTLNKTFAPAVPVLKDIGQQTAKVLIHQGIPMVASALGQAGGDALAVATGNPEFAPIAGQLGQQIGQRAGNALSKYTTQKTGYGIMINNVEQLTPKEKERKEIEHRVFEEERAKHKRSFIRGEKERVTKVVKKSTIKRNKDEMEDMHQKMARLRAMRKRN